MKIVLTCFLIVALSACSSSDDPIEVNPNDVTNTVWVNRYYVVSPFVNYEFFEFNEQNGFTLSEVSPEGLKRDRLLVGKYRQEGRFVYCECDKSRNKYRDVYPNDDFIMEVKDYGQTLYLSTNTKVSYMKQNNWLE